MRVRVDLDDCCKDCNVDVIWDFGIELKLQRTTPTAILSAADAEVLGHALLAAAANEREKKR